MQPQRDHAIVIGASMGGLLAARVLTDHFRRVTLIERDTFPAQPGEHRRGVPQSRHTHGLLASGLEVLERLFPGLMSEVEALGGSGGDIAGESRWFLEGGCLARVASGIRGVLVSRPLLEGIVRQRVRAIANLDIVEEAVVEELVATEDRAAVRGLRFQRNGMRLERPADLIVDASGRASKSAEWLAALGYQRPVEDRLEVGVAYTTRLFRRDPARHLNGDIAAVIPPTPQGKIGGVMLAQEGGRWTVTLISHFGSAAPSDLDGFREFARSLPAPFIHEVVSQAEPIGEAATARFPASVRRRYESIGAFPAGYLVFGDAICSFNPIYGQGMSVAARESEALDACLREPAAQSGSLAGRFFRRAARIIDTPWAIAAGSDLRIRETVGARTPAVRFINWYMAKLHRAAHRDPVLAVAFHRVSNLLAPPPTLMTPAMMWRVLRGNLGAASLPKRAAAPGEASVAAATSPRLS